MSFVSYLQIFFQTDMRFRVLTYMGMFNHDMEKGSHLQTNMRPGGRPKNKRFYCKTCIDLRFSFESKGSCLCQIPSIVLVDPASSLKLLQRKMTSDWRAFIKRRFARRQAKRDQKKVRGHPSLVNSCLCQLDASGCQNQSNRDSFIV